MGKKCPIWENLKVRIFYWIIAMFGCWDDASIFDFSRLTFPMDCLFSIGFSWYYVYKNPFCVQKSWLVLVIWSQGKIGGTDIPGPRLSDYLYARICSEACFYLFYIRVEQQKNSCLMEMNDVRSAVEELNMEKVSNKCTTCLLTVLNLLCEEFFGFFKDLS